MGSWFSVAKIQFTSLFYKRRTSPFLVYYIYPSPCIHSHDQHTHIHTQLALHPHSLLVCVWINQLQLPTDLSTQGPGLKIQSLDELIELANQVPNTELILLIFWSWFDEQNRALKVRQGKRGEKPVASLERGWKEGGKDDKNRFKEKEEGIEKKTNSGRAKRCKDDMRKEMMRRDRWREDAREYKSKGAQHCRKVADWHTLQTHTHPAFTNTQTHTSNIWGCVMEAVSTQWPS